MRWIKHDLGDKPDPQTISAIIDTTLLMILMQKANDRYFSLKREEYATVREEAEAGVWLAMSVELAIAAKDAAKGIYGSDSRITRCVDMQFQTMEQMAARMVPAVLIAVEQDCDPNDAMRQVANEMMEDLDNG